MIEILRHIDIAAPPTVVWPVMADVVRWHDWTASIRRIEPLDGEALQVGRRYRVIQPKLPPALWRVTEVVPDTGFVWVSTAPGAHIEGRHWITPTPTGCRVELRLRYRRLVGAAIGWLFKGISERYVALEAEGLKRRCETRG